MQGFGSHLTPGQRFSKASCPSLQSPQSPLRIQTQCLGRVIFHPLNLDSKDTPDLVVFWAELSALGGLLYEVIPFLQRAQGLVILPLGSLLTLELLAGLTVSGHPAAPSQEPHALILKWFKAWW